MPLQASKLDLLKTPSSSSSSISSLLFEHSSNSLALSFSDSSHLLFPSFSPSSSSPPTTIPPPSTSIFFLRLLPINRVLFFALSPLNEALALRAWILNLDPPRFESVQLTYRKRAPAMLALAHGFGVRVAGTVNYFAVHAPAAGQIWVMGARVEEEGGEGRMVGVDLVKCAVVDCELPIYAVGMSMGVMVLGEIGGVRVFSVRMLVKGRRKGGLDDGRKGKRVVANGAASADGWHDGGVFGRIEGVGEGNNDGNDASGKFV